MESISEVKFFIEQSIDTLSEVHIYLALHKQASVPDFEQKMLDCEKQCMYFKFVGGSVYHRGFNDEARLIKYPSFDLWDIDYYKYLKNRIQSVKHDKLIARYNQILFNGDVKLKREEQAKAAVDAYIRIIENGDYPVWPEGEQQEWSFIKLFDNLIGLSVSVKNYRETDIKNLIHSLLTERLADDLVFKHTMIHCLLGFPKMFKARDLEVMEEMIEDIVFKNWTDQNYFGTTHIIETGLALARRRKTDEKRWYEMLGRNNELFASQRSDDRTGIVPLTKTRDAILAFKKAGNTAKVNELGSKIIKLKENLRLTPVHRRMFKGKESEILGIINQQAQILLESDAENIFEYLKHQLFLPDEDFLLHIHNNVGNVFMPSDLLGLFSVTALDLNKNIKAQPETGEEVLQEEMRQGYLSFERTFLGPFIDLLFFKGIEAKLLTADSLLAILSKSWIGADLGDTDSSGDTKKYNWLKLLIPAIQIFFKEMTKAILNDDYEPALIPAIDSLVLKMEGMLRDLAWAIDENTIKFNRNYAMQEKTLEELLSLPKLKASLNPVDILFFRYVYTNFGHNLRNNISHGFFRAYHYSPYYGYLIILSILRLSSYEVIEVGDNK